MSDGLIDREQAAVGGSDWGCWVGGVEGLSKTRNEGEKPMDRNTSVVTSGGGGGVAEDGVGGINGDGWRRGLGGEHTIQCTGDVL